MMAEHAALDALCSSADSQHLVILFRQLLGVAEADAQAVAHPILDGTGGQPYRHRLEVQRHINKPLHWHEHICMNAQSCGAATGAATNAKGSSTAS